VIYYFGLGWVDFEDLSSEAGGGKWCMEDEGCRNFTSLASLRSIAVFVQAVFACGSSLLQLQPAFLQLFCS